MPAQEPSCIRRRVHALAKAAATLVISWALLAPAAAQFWNPFSSGFSRPQQRAPQPQQQQYNPFGALFGPTEQKRVQPKADNTQAPAAARRSPESLAQVTSPILVLGDSMADWLAYGLEEAFAERPEFGILRRHRSFAGLVRYDPRRDVEWPQIVREAIAADKPKYIVMMVGFHDRQQIRERAPTSPAGRAPATQPTPAAREDAEHHDPDSPEGRARASADAQNAELREQAPPEPARAPAQQQPSGPMEFQSEAWQAAYVRRIDATIAALKSANVPVFWVGLPPQRIARQSADAVYLNDLFRARAERAGIVYVDIWDGFVDEAGRYVLQGPDFEGQTRRLRSADTVYFTPAGARKLAHYVEREILRSLLSSSTPVALPAAEPAVPQPGRPGATRPLAGPVIPLTASIGGGNELLGGGAARPAATNALASRVLVRGEPITAPSGRADNFSWPRGGSSTIQEGEPDEPPIAPASMPAAAGPAPKGTPAPQATPQRPAARPSSPVAQQPPAQATPQGPTAAPRPKAQSSPQPADPRQPAQRKAPPPAPPRASNEAVPRPPLPIAR